MEKMLREKQMYWKLFIYAAPQNLTGVVKM
jgi:hypothetical protein